LTTGCSGFSTFFLFFPSRGFHHRFRLFLLLEEFLHFTDELPGVAVGIAEEIRAPETVETPALAFEDAGAENADPRWVRTSRG